MPAPTEHLPANHPLLALLQRHQRVLVAGAPGSGKSTLVRAAAATLAARGQACHCLSGDPGLPRIGPPGAACLGRWEAGEWRLEAIAALATLDAARFRLPLVQAVRRLAEQAPAGALLLDAPGVVRGTAGAELLPALVEASGAGALLVLATGDTRFPLHEECRALGLETVTLAPAPRASALRRSWRVALCSSAQRSPSRPWQDGATGCGQATATRRPPMKSCPAACGVSGRTSRPPGASWRPRSWNWLAPSPFCTTRSNTRFRPI
ncbi:MAG: hypothetical protein RI841_03395 [Halomonas sp.]|uniref:hypothetical protein n=1 Tax=Halomonas sp. TaxID=1486246 RepID=UPI0028703B7E|nr:hypothetical protein [Halomonas sp.]MDR9438533.1 hypothetical protein [Halomonas sp.]